MKPPLEETEHRAVVDWLRLRRIPFFAPVNENVFGGVIRGFLIGALGKARGNSVASRIISSIENRAKRLGKVPGAPDLVVLLPGGRTIFLEMKRKKGGRLSDSQKAFGARAEKFGHTYIVAKGAREAIEAIEKLLKEKANEED